MDFLVPFIRLKIRERSGMIYRMTPHLSRSAGRNKNVIFSDIVSDFHVFPPEVEEHSRFRGSSSMLIQALPQLADSAPIPIHVQLVRFSATANSICAENSGKCQFMQHGSQRNQAMFNIAGKIAGPHVLTSIWKQGFPGRSTVRYSHDARSL